jgi:hypothetical protein
MHEPPYSNEIREGIRSGIGRRISRVIKIVLAVALGIPIFGFVVKYLWNWLLPPLFGWHTITFWQALGLFLLCKILFGGFRGRGHRGGRGRRNRWGRGMGRHWEKMSPEEREKFRAGMRDCGRGFGRGRWREGREGRHGGDPETFTPNPAQPAAQ